MRVLQFIDVPWDSGLSHYALLLAEGLKNRGHHVFVSTVPGEKPWLKAERLGLQTIPLTSLRRLNPLRRFLKEQGIEILNAHTGSTHSLAVASALGRSVAVVRTRSDARDVRRRVGSRFLYQHTHRVIAAADYIRQSYLKKLRLPGRKVVTIYQGISLSQFSVKPLPAVQTVGIVARLDPVKGHRYLLEAVSLLRNVYPRLRIRVIGQEENIKERALRKAAEVLGIEGMVEFTGFQKSAADAMAACTIGVVASIGSEAVSRVALEWMASGRALAATQVGCLPELVKDGQTGVLVEPRDAASLARALGGLLRDPELCQRMGAAARQRVEETFGMQEFIEQTVRVYADAMKESACLN